MIDAILNIFRIPDLRKRVLFTLGIIALLQIGKYIPVPGVNPIALHNDLASGAGGLFNLFDLFAGGATKRCSIFALGIMPYISASIILQLLTVTSPFLEELAKKGEEGKKKISQYTRYLTVAITLFQAFMLSFALENPQTSGEAIQNPGWEFRFMAMFSMTAGTMIIMWMGELITEHGIGNGISLIIFANIISRVPLAFAEGIQLISMDDTSFTPIKAIVTFMVLIVVIAGVVVIQFGQRRVPIKRGRMVRGGRMYGAQSNSYLPLRVNTAGVIPVIFASSILILPATFVQFALPIESSQYFGWIHTALLWISENLSRGFFLYSILYVALIIFFCYFYTAITFNPKDVAENLQKYGSTIPGYSHGKRTEEYLTRILNRITLVGAIALSMIAILPDIMQNYMKIPPDLANLLGGTSIIIVVGVALDTVSQIENHLRVRNYDGFRKHGRVKSRSGM